MKKYQQIDRFLIERAIQLFKHCLVGIYRIFGDRASVVKCMAGRTERYQITETILSTRVDFPYLM